MNTDRYGSGAEGLRPIALIGFMGVGKTAVGRRLAGLLDYEFRDTDVLVEESAGMSVARIFQTLGEAEFRMREREALCRALSATNRVVSAGGGLTLSPENRSILAEKARVVLLTADPVVILQRVRPLEKRPLLAGSPNPLQRIRNLLAERADYYREYDFAADTSEVEASVTARIIARWYLGLKEVS